MNRFFLFAALCLSTAVSSQPTFNIQSDFGFPYIYLRSVLPTDSCYYVTGIINDTVGGATKIGSIFLKIGLDGETLASKKLLPGQKSHQMWHGDLLPEPDGTLTGICLVVDSVFRGGVIRFDTDGDTLWTKEFNSPFPDNEIFLPYQVVPCPDGGYLVMNIVEMANLNSQLLLTRLDSALGVLWQKEYGGSMDEVGGSMILDGDGGFVIGANKANTNTNIQNYTSRTLICKTDAFGNLEWEYLSPGGELQDIAYSMVPTPDGGLVVASGRGIEHWVNAEVGQLRWHGYLFKLDADHQFVWGRELQGTRHSGSTRLIGVRPAPDSSGFVAYGNLIENVSDGTEHIGSWIVKVSNQGDSLWARYYTFFDGHDRSPRPADFKATPDGGYIVAGQTKEGLLDFGWLMKLDAHGCLVPGCHAGDGPNAVPREASQGPGPRLAVYPNPATDFLNFELRPGRHAPGGAYRIVDAAGREVRRYGARLPSGTGIVPLRGWLPGTYFLQYLEDGKLLAAERFVVGR